MEYRNGAVPEVGMRVISPSLPHSLASSTIVKSLRNVGGVVQVVLSFGTHWKESVLEQLCILWLLVKQACILSVPAPPVPAYVYSAIPFASVLTENVLPAFGPEVTWKVTWRLAIGWPREFTTEALTV